MRPMVKTKVTSVKPLRVGIVGCGHIAQEQHIPSLLKIKDTELVAICDRNEDLARRVSERYHISSYYTDFSDMLAKEKLGMVDICTAPQTHLALSVSAMEAGCHVLVEKPMALSLKEADMMAEAAKASQVELCVVHNELFEAVVMKAQSMVSEGAIGDLVAVNITDLTPKSYDWVMDKEHWAHKLPGGIFGEMLPHPLYLATAFLGHLEPKAVNSRKLGSYDWLTADELRITLEGKNGIATIISSINTLEDNVLIDVLGTKMGLRVSLWNSALTTFGRGGHRRVTRGLENLRQGFAILIGTALAALNFTLGRQHRGHYTLIQGFVKSLQNGSEPPVTVEEAREVVRLYEAITEQI